MGFSRLFRSRWKALFWSLGILWTAYDVADEAPEPAKTVAAGHAAATHPTDTTGALFDPQDLAVLANAAG